MNLSSLTNKAGGLRYHLRARRFAQTLWQPYRWAIGEVMLGWKPKADTLLLVGPSAGYCLQPFLFEGFERVVCLEPDPLARYLFARKIRRTPLSPRPKLEFLADDHLLAQPEKLVKLADGLGDCAVLFSNVLGQLRVLLEIDELDAPALKRVRAAIHEVTARRPFASFHDRVSGTIRPVFHQPLHSSCRLDDASLIEQLYTSKVRAQEALTTSNWSLLDHLTEGLFPADLPHSYLSWQLDPDRYHIIEWVCSNASPPA